MLLALLLVVANFTTLIGGSPLLATTFIALIGIAGCAGLGLALRWRRADPQRYARLGSFRG